VSAKECSCEHVDIGVGMQKVAEDPECAVCVPPENRVKGPRIVFGGDTHGDQGQVRWLIEKAVKEEADAVFILGDFGIWDHLDDGKFTKGVTKVAAHAGIPVYFLPGNHENYDLLERYEREFARDEDGFVLLSRHLRYSPRGHRWTWGGLRFLSLGGAYSIDKYWRVIEDEQQVRRASMRQDRGSKLTSKERYALEYGQLSWWRQEEINDAERDRAMEGGEVDIMLTHDKPLASSPEWNRKNIEECVPNQTKIQAVVDKTRPDLLLHGHLHFAYGDYLSETGTEVRALDCDPDASISSGGGGLRHQSYVVLELNPHGEAGWMLVWQAEDGSYQHTLKR
jgi:UDP-2,3-diacylglucosamine pyrophosphatase LpxH